MSKLPSVIQYGDVTVLHKNVIATTDEQISVYSGLTFLEIIQDLGYRPECCWVFSVDAEFNESFIEAKHWPRVRPKSGTYRILERPAGDNPLLTILSIAAIAVSGPAGGAIAGSAFGAGLSAATWSAIVTVGLNLLISAVVPMSGVSAGKSSFKDSPTLDISGSQNSVRSGPVPYHIGTNRFTPPLASQPVKEASGKDVYYKQVFLIGYAPLKLDIDEFKIGDTPLSDYSDYELQVHDGYENFNDITVINGDDTVQSGISALLKYNEPVQYTGGIDAEEATIIVAFNSGLLRLSSSGKYRNQYVDLKVEYRKVGDTTWIPAIALEKYNVRAVRNSINVTYQKRIDKENWEATTSLASRSYIEFLDGIPLDVVEGGNLRIYGSKYNNGVYEILSIDGNKAYVSDYKIFMGFLSREGKTLTSESGDLSINKGGAGAETFRFTDATAQVTYRTVTIPSLPKGQYEFQLTRTSTETDSNRVYEDMTLVQLKTTQYTDDDGAPLRTFPEGFAYVGLKIKGTDQLNGTISQFSCLAQSVPYRYDLDNETFVQDADVSGNNAWEYMSLIISNAVKKQQPTDSIDYAALSEWADRCDELVNGKPRHRCNHVVDYEGRLDDVMQRIASTGRATRFQIDGVESISMDVGGRERVQTFTESNTYGFTANKSYAQRPDAFRCQFVNPDNDWTTDYVQVKRDDALDDADVDLVEDLDCVGMTDVDEVYRYAKFAHAYLSLRPETYTLTTGIEHVRCRRYDVVGVSHSRIQGDVHSGRVIGISGSTITINNKPVLDPAKTYYAEFRHATAIQNGGTFEITSATENVFTLDGVMSDDLAIGDIMHIGSSVESITTKYIVTNIANKSDLNAELTLVNYADPEIYESESGVIPEYETGYSKPAIKTWAAPLSPVVLDYYADEKALLVDTDGSLVTRIALNTERTKDDTRPEPSHIRVYYRPTGTDALWDIDTYTADQLTVFATRVYEGLEYDIKLAYLTQYGIMSEFAYQDAILVTGKTNPPSDVENLTYSFNKGSYTLKWDHISDLDRYAYDLYKDGELFAQVQSNIYDLTNMNNGSNTYSIRAVDTTGNTSVNETSITFIVDVSPPAVSIIDSGTDHLILNDDGTINTRIYCEWDAVDAASFYEIQYRISTDSNYDSYTVADTKTFIESVKAGATYYIQLRSIGQTASVYSEWTTVTHVVTGKSQPPSDVQNASIDIEDRNLIIQWDAISDADVAGYEVRKGLSWNTSTFVAYVDTTSWSRPADVTGSHKWLIKAVDTSGLYSLNAKAATIMISPPYDVTVTAQVIDNNVLLKYSAVKGTLPIDEYEIERGGEVVGSSSSTFAAIYEDSSGQYTYNVTAIDIAGNRSGTGSFTATVNQPPDYVLNARFDSDFSGTKTNAHVDDVGRLIMLTDGGQTWGDYLTNTSSYTTLASEVSAGYTHWLTPTNNATAVYQETYDYGAILAATLISITPSVYRKVGTPTITPKIEVSTDNSTWTEYNGVYSIYATSFRYVRFTLTVVPDDDNDQVIYSKIEFKLDSKLKSDALSGYANAGDADGTEFNFNIPFVDITAITCTPASGSTAAYALYNFVDTPYPTSFKVLLLDIDGNRVSGNFSAAIRGY